MRLFLATLFGIAALVAVMPPADARDGCGRGWYFDGRACRPQEPNYQPDYYAPPRPAYRQVPYGSCLPRTNPRWPCPCDNWTVQDGVCKPFTGR